MADLKEIKKQYQQFLDLLPNLGDSYQIHKDAQKIQEEILRIEREKKLERILKSI